MKEVHTYIGCCLFYLGQFKDAEAEVNLGPATDLQTRLLFHLSHKFNDETKLMFYHRNLKDVVEDQVLRFKNYSLTLSSSVLLPYNICVVTTRRL